MSGAISYEQITDLSESTALTVGDSWPTSVMLQAETQNVRYRLDGGDPTATVGLLLVAGDPEPTQIDGIGNLRNLRFIEAADGAILNISFS